MPDADRPAPEPLTPEPWEVAETLVMEARRYRGTLAKVTKQDWLMIAAAVVLADRERAARAGDGLRGQLLNALGRYADLRDHGMLHTAADDWTEIEVLMARLARPAQSSTRSRSPT